MDIYAIRLNNMRLLVQRAGGRPAFAKKINMNYTQLNQYIGKNPTKNIGDQAARNTEEKMGLPHGWMDTLQSDTELPPLPHEAGNIVTKPRPVSLYDEGDELDEDEIEVVALRLKMSAGNGVIQWESDDEGKRHRYSKRWAASLNIRHPEKLTTVVVEGDSMEPRIPSGASITIYTHITTIRSGQVFALDYLGEFFVKRLFKEPNGVRMVSDSPDKVKYPDSFIPAEHADSLRILGAVVDVKYRPIDGPWW
ncbi:S24 family peptidase [Chitinimonas sp. PSY-7]|uniref:S24 family peptidase n=1 Tax=Chitinimonas sp. PSY-7 TaxID=3459088 RepID=UPI00404007DA